MLEKINTDQSTDLGGQNPKRIYKSEEQIDKLAPNSLQVYSFDLLKVNNSKKENL